MKSIPSLAALAIDRLRATRRWAICGVAFSAMGLSLASCSLPLPQASNDPTKFYVLAAPEAPAMPSAPKPVPAVRLRPVELASYLQARPMIVRHGENEIEFRDFARWGEPLEQGIARVLREELLARHAVASVQAGAVRPSDVQDVPFDITVRIVACEGGADGAVLFRAVWQIVSTADKGTVVARGDYRPTDLRWTPKSEATLAAALSRAVSGLAGEIAAAMPK